MISSGIGFIQLLSSRHFTIKTITGELDKHIKL